MRRGLSRLLYYTVPLALGLLAAEGVLRLRGFGRRITYQSSMDVLWEPSPGQSGFNNLTNARVTIDENGLRVAPSIDTSSPGRIRVLALGDSVTYGFGLADQETYVAVLQARLEGEEPGRWRLMNAGVNGYNFYLVRQRLVRLLERGTKPDLLLVGYCFNEFEAWPGEHFTPEQKADIIRGVRRKNRLRASAIFNVLTEVVGPEFFYGLRNRLMPQATAAASYPKAKPPEQSWRERYRARVDGLLREADERGVPLMVLIWPDKSGATGSYRRVLMEECERRGIPYLNLAELLSGRDRSQMFFDFEHPRPETVRLIVEGSVLPFFRAHASRLVSKAAP